LKSSEVGWEGNGLLSVYCTLHIAYDFNNKFKNVELNKHLIDTNIYLNLIYFY